MVHQSFSPSSPSGSGQQQQQQQQQQQPRGDSGDSASGGCGGGGPISIVGSIISQQVRENILPRLEHEIRNNVVPRLERTGKELTKRWDQHQHQYQQQQKADHQQRKCGRKNNNQNQNYHPPSSTDIVYMTNRFLVSSKPAVGGVDGPTFLDTGQDVTKKQTKEQKYPYHQQKSQNDTKTTTITTTESISILNRSPSTCSIPESSEEQEIPSHPAAVAAAIVHQVNDDEEDKLDEYPQDGCADVDADVDDDDIDTNVIDNDTTNNILLKNTVTTTSNKVDKNLIEDEHDLPENIESYRVGGTEATEGEKIEDFNVVSSNNIRSSTPPVLSIVTDPSSSCMLNENDDTNTITNNGDSNEDNDNSMEKMSRRNKINQQPQQQQSTPRAKNVTMPMIDLATPKSSGRTPSTILLSPSLLPSQSFFVDDVNSFEQQQQQQPPSQRSSNGDGNRNAPTTPTPTNTNLHHPPTSSSSSSSSKIINSPGNMVTYLDKAHRDRYLAFSFSKEEPDDRTLLLFRRQIVKMGGKKWSPCCVERSETPSIPHILKSCYALHAFLQLDPDNVVLSYCDNGKTRTAIVAACYFKFANMVERTEDGFRYFLSQLRKHRQLLLERERERRKILGPIMSAAYDVLDDEFENEEKSNAVVNNILNQIPPSLKLFFRQFDKVLQLGGFLNRKPLLLRAITLQGVPVEDQPCLDIWDSSQRHVYSSHPTSLTHNSTITGNNKPVSQWVDEEGFYRINVVLDGEFLVLCRFGGNSATSSNESRIHDPSKILFRYTNTTGFLSGGCSYELSSRKVDLMRRYSDHLDDEDFICTLLFEADWEQIDDDDVNDANNNSNNLRVLSAAMKERLKSSSESCGKRIWRCHEEEARDEGWKVIFDCHSARPTIVDIASFRRFNGNQEILDMNRCPDHLITLSLQLTNYDFQRSTILLLDSPVFSWWREDGPSPLVETTSDTQKTLHDEKKDEKVRCDHEINNTNDNINDKKTFREIEDEATRNIFKILDQIDVTANLDPPDIRYLEELKERQPKANSQHPSHGVREQQDKFPPTQEDNNTSQRRQSLIGLCLKETGYRIPSMMYPRRGDIAKAFNFYGDERQNEKGGALSSLGAFNVSISKPRLPYFPHDRPKILPSPSTRLQNKNGFDKIEGIRVPIYDPKLEAAKEIHMQLRHTGVTLKDLIELEEASKHWTGVCDNSTNNNDMSSDSNPISTTDAATAQTKFPEQRDSSMNREEKEKKEKKWKEDQVAEAEEKQKALLEKRLLREKTAEQQTKVGKPEKLENAADSGEKGEELPLKDDPEYKKYFTMIKIGMAREQVVHSMKRDEKDSNILDLNPTKSLQSQQSQLTGIGGENNIEEILLKDDPEYAKYFKMIKMGMAREQVLHAMKRDEKDQRILDFDANKSLKSQEVVEATGNDTEPPLKDDPEYTKYFKMLKIGMPREQVLHAMTRDEKDSKILNLDPNKSLKSQKVVEATGNDDGPPLKEDPEFSKYFKMIKMGIPREQALHAMKRDEKDPKILDLDPNKSLKSQKVAEATGNDDGPPLKDDPEFSKYFKMTKMGIPREQALHAMKRDEKDPKILDLDPNKSLKSQQLETAGDDGPPLKDDPDYAKYFKMEKMGLPKGSIKNALVRDGKDSGIIDLDPNKSLKSQLVEREIEEEKDTGIPLKDDPEYAKYFKMKKMGLPIGSVKNALVRDGKDSVIIDLDPNKSLKYQLGGREIEEKDTGIPLKDDPEYAKYFKMKKMGLPKDAVRNALARDGKDSSIIDLDPEKSVVFQMKKKNSFPKNATIKKKKKKVRRKKIYWNPVDPNKLKKDSLWNIVRDHVQMGSLDYDQKEFEELFTESAESSSLKKKKTPQKEAKKLVQAIDPKRSMNGGIVLSRLKTDHKKVAEYVDMMEYNKFDATQLKNLKEYLANADERRALVAYMSKGASSEEKKKELYNDLSETEKYMVTLMEVSDANAKLHTMEFRCSFKNRFADITSAVQTLNFACDELRSSEKLRKLMAMILTVVNQINTGGEGNLATGFTLDALLKLNEAKAFDRKTSVLHYVVKLVKKNDETLLAFESDVCHVIPAESVLLDTVAGDVKVIQEELEDTVKIVSKEAERLEKAGNLPKLTLSDLLEQKSIVKSIGSVPQFNKISHLTGRTSMERFAMNARVACDQAVESVESVKSKYASLLGYFGEDENMPTGEFFGILRRFMSEWKKAIKQIEKIERAQAKERKREERRVAKEKKSKGSNIVSEKTKTARPGGIAALAAQVAKTKRDSTKQSIDEAFKRAPVGGIAALVAQAALKKNSSKLSANEATKKEPAGEEAQKIIVQMSANDNQVEVKSKKSKEQEGKCNVKDTINTDGNETLCASSSVPTVENNYVSKATVSPAIEAQVENSTATPSTSLGNFLEGEKSSSDYELRSEVCRQNYDDSSVAIMVLENLEKSSDGGVSNNNNSNFTATATATATAWDKTGGNGISDYMGWANQAIKASDTESVRGFEAPRNIVDNYDHDDESTIATNFDDDASIVTAMTTPQNHNYTERGDDYNNHNNDHPDGIYNSQEYHDSYGGNNDDSVIDMPVSFNNICGVDARLSFGDGGSLEDGTETYGVGSGDLFGVDDGIGGFGGLGGFGSAMGMLSPTTGHQDPNNSISNNAISESMNPSTTTTGGNDDLNLPWGASVRGTDSRDSSSDNNNLNRPWATSTLEGNNNKSDQQQNTQRTNKKWFSSWGGSGDGGGG